MNENIEIIRGSGNIFRDFNDPNADVLQAKALLAAKIIGVLDDKKLSTKKAAKITGIEQNVFDRIRQPDLKRFTIDRLISILNKLDQHVEFNIHVIERSSPHDSLPAHS